MSKKPILPLALSIAGSFCATSCSSNRSYDLDLEGIEAKRMWEKQIENEKREINDRLFNVISNELNIDKSQLGAGYFESSGEFQDRLAQHISIIEKSFSISIIDAEREQLANLESLTDLIWEKINPPCHEDWSEYRFIDYPENLYYTKYGHWVLVEGDTATIGITPQARENYTPHEVYFYYINQPNTMIKKGQEFAALEDVKIVMDIISPVSGLISQINNELPGCVYYVEDDAYGAGWMLRVIMSDKSEIESFLSPEEYEELVHEKYNEFEYYDPTEDE